MQMWLVREVGKNWLALVKQAALSVVAPARARLRRTMILGEAARCALPWTRIDSLIPETLTDGQSLALKAIHTTDHNCSFHELSTLAVIAKWVAPAKALEIGTFDGRSALAIAANMPEDGRLWTMNLPPTHADGTANGASYDERLATKVESGYRFKSMPEAKRITQIFGDSTKYDYTGMGPFQYIFIDGGHGEGIVRQDTTNALNLVDRGKGVILWHDATRYGVRPALARFRKSGLPISLILGTSIAILCFRDGRPIELPY